MIFNKSIEPKICHILIGNFGVESNWEAKNSFHFIKIQNRIRDEMIEKAYSFMIYCAKRDDLIVLGEEIPKFYRDYLISHNITIPEQCIINKKKSIHSSITEDILNDPSALIKLKQYVDTKLKNGQKVFLVPFAVTKWEDLLAKQLGVSLMFSDSMVSKQLNNKGFVRNLCLELGLTCPEGGIAWRFDQVKAISKHLFTIFNKIVIKELYGASGLGMVVITRREFNDICMQMERNFKKGKGPVVIEGWYPAKYSLNTQYFFSENDVSFLCISKQVVNNGLYQGAIFDNQNFLSEEEYEKLKSLLIKIRDMGYEGIVGIDSLTCCDGKFIPCLEINARLNLSTFAHLACCQLAPISSAIHFWVDVIIENSSQISYLFELISDIDFNHTNKKGVFCMNIISVKNENRYYYRLHFLIFDINIQRIIEAQKVLIDRISKHFHFA